LPLLERKTFKLGILGHILQESGADVTAFIGGIVENYNSNLIGSGKTVTVVEADEFDRSFCICIPYCVHNLYGWII
jgi:UDP-N-acetylmuramate--alanine ligase